MAPEQGILAEIIDLNAEPLPGDPDPTLYLGGGHGSWILAAVVTRRPTAGPTESEYLMQRIYVVLSLFSCWLK